MSLDSKQFIATADGSQIRLFPENYGILERLGSVTDWKLNIDQGVGLELARAIFEEYYTNHSMRWGDKQVALDALNALVCDERPKAIFTTDWEPMDMQGGYHLWSRYIDGDEIFQATITQNPPQNGAGYKGLDALLKLKGIK